MPMPRRLALPICRPCDAFLHTSVQAWPAIRGGAVAKQGASERLAWLPTLHTAAGAAPALRARCRRRAAAWERAGVGACRGAVDECLAVQCTQGNLGVSTGGPCMAMLDRAAGRWARSCLVGGAPPARGHPSALEPARRHTMEMEVHLTANGSSRAQHLLPAPMADAQGAEAPKRPPLGLAVRTKAPQHPRLAALKVGAPRPPRLETLRPGWLGNLCALGGSRALPRPPGTAVGCRGAPGRRPARGRAGNPSCGCRPTWRRRPYRPASRLPAGRAGAARHQPPQPPGVHGAGREWLGLRCVAPPRCAGRARDGSAGGDAS